MTKKTRKFIQFVDIFEIQKSREEELQTIEELKKFRDETYTWNSKGFNLVNTIINYLEELMKEELEEPV